MVLIMLDEANVDYLNGLKPGERVIETTLSGMYHKTGTVYIPLYCVMGKLPCVNH
jgi:hypothetical protein